MRRNAAALLRWGPVLRAAAARLEVLDVDGTGEPTRLLASQPAALWCSTLLFAPADMAVSARTSFLGGAVMRMGVCT